MRREFGELECAVLRCLEGGEALTVRDVQGQLGSQSAYTTIMTVLTRLVEKGVCQRKKCGRSFLYQLPKQSRGVFDRFKQRFFGGNSAEMVKALVDDEALSLSELETIEQLIRDAKKRKRS